MDLTPSADQAALVAATADWCRDNLPSAEARSRRPGLWRELEAMGWLGMTAPDVGLDHASEALIFAELGRFLAPVGMIPTAVAVRWARVTGKVALALSEGGVVRVFDPEGALGALGLAGGFAAIAPLPAGLTAEPGLDLTSPMAILAAAPTFERIEDRSAALHLQLLAAALALGCAEAARDMAAEYAQVREQFERPIGWFQALKHLCSDMAVRCAVARSQLYYAACTLDGGAPDAAFHIAAAKRLADQAALENGRANIQVHGGIGMTDEATPHLCLKRAHLLAFVAPATTADLLGEAA
jgi:alkylation response protein AidB-like acyl-CoA dehydrogenase